MGADAKSAWADVPDGSVTADIAQALVRVQDAGAAPSAAIEQLAHRVRGELAAAALGRAERVGVLIAGPLGLCFLPAFVVLGIVPIVLGLIRGFTLGGGLW